MAHIEHCPPATTGRRARSPSARRTGWCGLGMVAAILINGPLSIALGRVPNYWTDDAQRRTETFLANASNINRSVAFFALSNLIFVFAIGFFAGLRLLADDTDESGWTKGVVTIGAALFLAGGLLSETLSSGVAVVLKSTPAYQLDVNTALLLQGLWSTAIAQGQVALGVLVGVLSAAALRNRTLPTWLAWLGIIVGAVAILRPAIVTEVPIFIVTFQPMFIWIAATSIVLLRSAPDPAPTPHQRELTVARCGGSASIVDTDAAAVVGASAGVKCIGCGYTRRGR